MTRFNEILNNIKQYFSSAEESEDFMSMEEIETTEQEMMEYKKDFYEMSVGSIRAIMNHSKSILDSLENPTVRDNLTESWLQGKIAITEDYMRLL